MYTVLHTNCTDYELVHTFIKTHPDPYELNFRGKNRLKSPMTVYLAHHFNCVLTIWYLKLYKNALHALSGKSRITKLQNLWFQSFAMYISVCMFIL